MSLNDNILIENDHYYGCNDLSSKITRTYLCGVCQKTFCNRSSLARHCLTIHRFKISANQRSCNLCSKRFHSLTLLRDHHIACHDYVDKRQDKTFSSFTDFLAWKVKIEEETVSSFIKQTSQHKLPGRLRHYYVCNRSGTYMPEGKGLRRLKSQGSCKIGFYCLAEMIVDQNFDGSVHVLYHSNHYGHDFDDAHLALSMSKKAKMGHLELPVDESQDTFEEIENVSETTTTTIIVHKITPKDKVIFMAELLLDKLKTTDLSQNELMEIDNSLSKLLNVV